MRTPDNSLPASVVVVCGSMGSGKSHATKKAIAAESDVFVFDVKNEYGSIKGFKIAHDRAELVKLVKAGGRIAYPASTEEEFGFFCRVVWLKGGCLVICEELASVTHPGKASGWWHLICTQGRGFGIRVIGITQRPAEIDKTIVGNATMFRSHRLTRVDDEKYIEKEMRLPPGALAKLTGFESITFDILNQRYDQPQHVTARVVTPALPAPTRALAGPKSARKAKRKR